MMRVEPVGWPDLHGFEVDWWGKEEEHEELMNTHQPDTNAHQHDVIRFLPRARIHTPNRINKRKTLG